MSGDYEVLLSDDEEDGWDLDRGSMSTAPRHASRKVVKSVGKKLRKSLAVVALSPVASRRARSRTIEAAPRYSNCGASAPSVEWLYPFVLLSLRGVRYRAE